MKIDPPLIGTMVRVRIRVPSMPDVAMYGEPEALRIVGRAPRGEVVLVLETSVLPDDALGFKWEHVRVRVLTSEGRTGWVYGGNLEPLLPG